jgi:hypothetical protein
MALEHCWNKCISLKGDYVENKNNFEMIHSFFLLLGRELFRPPSYISNKTFLLSKFTVIARA